MTRKMIHGLVDELKALARTGGLSEYEKARDSFLAKVVPLCNQSKQTMLLIETMRESLKVGHYIPAKNEASAQEIETIKREAHDDIMKRIALLESSLRDTMKVNLPLAVFASLVMIGGITMLAYAGGHIVSAGKSVLWPSAEGRIQKITLSERRSSSSVGRIGTRSESASYGINVEYEYDVGGASYRGRRFSFEPRSGDREYWEEKIRRFKAGSTMSVHYDPRKPQNSALEIGAYEWNYVFIVMGLAFTGAGLYLTAKMVKFQFF